MNQPARAGAIGIAASRHGGAGFVCRPATIVVVETHERPRLRAGRPALLRRARAGPGTAGDSVVSEYRVSWFRNIGWARAAGTGSAKRSGIPSSPGQSLHICRSRRVPASLRW